MHYSEGQWIDFVRGLADPKLARDMQDHLGLPCTECLSLVASLSVVERTAARDRVHPVPPAAVLRAVSIFRPEPRASILDVPRRLAELLLDSRQQPLLAGARTVDQQARQLVFRAMEIRVDLRMEVLAPKRILLLTGQFSSESSETDSINGVRVAVVDGQRILAEAQTNSFGEFELECRPQPGVQLLAWPYGSAEAFVMALETDPGKQNKESID